MVKVLHTSDWHLGRSLYYKKRYSEFQQFLDWLLLTIRQEAIDILIIAGDIFDSTTPSIKAQELYYQFLCQVAITTGCQHVVVIAGNHDSPSLLSAPGSILKQLHIHVVASVSANLADEVLILNDGQQQPLAIVCAVPFLRDKELRSVIADETAADKDLRLMAAIRQHYAEVCQIAEATRQELQVTIPIIGVGHLFVAGGKTEVDDGVRELYVGSLARFGANDFPPNLDYLALGHLHGAQIVNGQAHLRYSGAPLAMGFGETQQPKVILSLEFAGHELKQINQLAVPCFQRLLRISGDLEQLQVQLQQLIAYHESIWVEAIYTGAEVQVNLRQQLQEYVAASQVEVIKVVNQQLMNKIRLNAEPISNIELSELTPLQVFEQCLLQNEVPLEQQVELKECYQLVLDEIACLDRSLEV